MEGIAWLHRILSLFSFISSNLLWPNFDYFCWNRKIKRTVCRASKNVRLKWTMRTAIHSHARKHMHKFILHTWAQHINLYLINLLPFIIELLPFLIKSYLSEVFPIRIISSLLFQNFLFSHNEEKLVPCKTTTKFESY